MSRARSFNNDGRSKTALNSINIGNCSLNPNIRALRKAKLIMGPWPDKKDQNFNQYQTSYNKTFNLDVIDRNKEQRAVDMHLHTLPNESDEPLDIEDAKSNTSKKSKFLLNVPYYMKDANNNVREKFAFWDKCLELKNKHQHYDFN